MQKVVRVARVGVAAGSVAVVSACGTSLAGPATAATGTAPAVVTSPVDGSLVVTAKPTVAGLSSASASVTVNVDGSRYCTSTDALGYFSCSPSNSAKGLELGGHTLQTVSGPFATTTSFTYMPPSVIPPLVITRPDALTSLKTPVFVGTGMPEAVVGLADADTGQFWGEATVDADGNWSLTVPDLPQSRFIVAAVTYSYRGGLVSTTASHPYFYVPGEPAAVEAARVAVTTPTSGLSCR
ncbi:Ig-like domain-containing protein [Leifsonia lichenia]